jgi:hypothetical protein
MNNRFVVILPLNVQQLNYGFTSYKETTSIVCEASSVFELYKKYPNALIIQKLKVRRNNY